MSAQVSLDITIKPVGHEERTAGEWLTNFHIAAVVIDPYTHESAWILPTAARILRHFKDADCRTVFIVVGTEDEAKQFLGPMTDDFLTLCDPDRHLVKGAELETLPAFMHITPTGLVANKTEGWEPLAWREVAAALAKAMSWSYPTIPQPGDPVAYPGSSAT